MNEKFLNKQIEWKSIPIENIERIKIVEEKKSYFKVLYNGQIVPIIKSTETCYRFRPEIYANDHPELTYAIQPNRHVQIYINMSVNKGFIEPLMFHELREIEYLDSNVTDDVDGAHILADIDMQKYVKKYYDEDYQKRFAKFSVIEKQRQKEKEEKEQ
jgi:hypothetical protein